MSKPPPRDRSDRTDVVDESLPADLRSLQKMANAMDRAVKIPIIGVEVGLDAVVGLVPGVGDVAAGAVSASLLLGALRHRVPLWVIVKMAFWILFDMLIGVVPVAGDFLDVICQSNTRNMKLLLENRDTERAPRSIPGIFGVILAILLALGGFSVAFYGAILWGALALGRSGN
jgi:hypothetical protein